MGKVAGRSNLSTTSQPPPFFWQAWTLTRVLKSNRLAALAATSTPSAEITNAVVTSADVKIGFAFSRIDLWLICMSSLHFRRPDSIQLQARTHPGAQSAASRTGRISGYLGFALCL